MIYEWNGKCPIVHAEAFVAPNTSVIGDVILEEGANCWFGAVLRGDEAQIVVGKGSNIQDNAVVHCDAGVPVRIGEYVTVGHNAILHSCEVDDGAMIGMGAVVLNGAKIGKGAIVAAGSTVLEKMEIPPEAAERVRANGLRYVSLAEEYMDSGIGSMGYQKV